MLPRFLDLLNGSTLGDLPILSDSENIFAFEASSTQRLLIFGKYSGRRGIAVL